MKPSGARPQKAATTLLQSSSPSAESPRSSSPDLRPCCTPLGVLGGVPWCGGVEPEGLAQDISALFDGGLGLRETGFSLQQFDLKSQCLDFGDQPNLEFALGQFEIGLRLGQTLFLDLEPANILH